MESHKDEDSDSDNYYEAIVKDSAVDPNWVLEKKGVYPDDRQRTAPWRQSRNHDASQESGVRVSL